MHSRPLGGEQVVWSPRFLYLHGYHGFRATASTPATPHENCLVARRHLKSGFWPARRFRSLAELDAQCADWRDRICNRRRHATRRVIFSERLTEEWALPPAPLGLVGDEPTGEPESSALRALGEQARYLPVLFVSRGRTSKPITAIRSAP